MDALFYIALCPIIAGLLWATYVRFMEKCGATRIPLAPSGDDRPHYFLVLWLFGAICSTVILPVVGGAIAVLVYGGIFIFAVISRLLQLA